MPKFQFTVLACLLAAACASNGPAPQSANAKVEGPPDRRAKARPAPALAAARSIKSEKGCAAAAPTYRVTAAMGEGFEVAQSEFGMCLLQMTGGTDAETALFRQEGVFWLTRAAYAGEARAQRRLAEHARQTGDHAAALSWALAFTDNSQTELFSFSPLAPDFIKSVSASLSASEIEAAHDFAKMLPSIKMAGYTPTSQRQAQSRARGQQPRPQNRRPRRADVSDGN